MSEHQIESRLRKIEREIARDNDRDELAEFNTGSLSSTAYFNFAGAIAVPVALPNIMKVRRISCMVHHAVGTSRLSAGIYKTMTPELVQPVTGTALLERGTLQLQRLATALVDVDVDGTPTVRDFDFFPEVVLDPRKGEIFVVFSDSVGNTRFGVVENWGFDTRFLTGATSGLEAVVSAQPGGATAGNGRVLLAMRSLKGMNLLGR